MIYAYPGIAKCASREEPARGTRRSDRRGPATPSGGYRTVVYRVFIVSADAIFVAIICPLEFFL